MESISKKSMENSLHQRAFSETSKTKRRRRRRNMEGLLSVLAQAVVQLASQTSASPSLSHYPSSAASYVVFVASQLLAAIRRAMENKKMMKEKKRNENE